MVETITLPNSVVQGSSSEMTCSYDLTYMMLKIKA